MRIRFEYSARLRMNDEQLSDLTRTPLRPPRRPSCRRRGSHPSGRKAVAEPGGLPGFSLPPLFGRKF